MADFFVLDMGLVLVAKRVPTDHRPSNRSITVRCLPTRYYKRNFSFCFFFFSERAGCRYSRHVRKTYRYHSIFRRSDCVGPISSHISRAKVIRCWNETKYLRGNALFFLHFCIMHKSPNVHARFLENLDPDCLHTRSMSPCQAVVTHFFFPIGKVLDLPKRRKYPTLPKKNWRKTDQKRSVSGW